METHVHVPVRITLTGEPGPDELAALTRRLTALVAGRLALAERELGRGRRTAEWAVGGGGAREVHEPGRDVAGGYTLPSYAGAGRPTTVPVNAPAPWTVVGTARARIEVGRFIGFVEGELRQPFPQGALYRSIAGSVRAADVWLVRVDKDYEPDELGRELVARGSAEEGSGATEPAWFFSGSAAVLQRLAQADASGTVAARLPYLPQRHVVFAAMRLPRVELADVAFLGPALRVTVTVREAGFCVDPVVFERATGLPWRRYAEEYAGEKTVVWTQPVVLRSASNAVRTPAGIERDALRLLFQRHLGAGPPHHEPAARLFVADGEILHGVPEPVRRAAVWPGEAGERVLYCRAGLDLRTETLGAALFRPEARRLAGELIALFDEDGFAAALDALLTRSVSQDRGRSGTLLQYVLESLEQRGKLGEFFASADATRRFALRLRLLQQCEAGPYAHHEKVAALRAALARERAATTAHAYTVGGPGKGAVRLDRRPDGTVLAGELLGKADPLYRKRRDITRPKPGRADALRAALLAERGHMVGNILAGDDRRDYSEEEFRTVAVDRAARAVRFTADDFEEKEVEYGIALLEVFDAQEQGLPSYEIGFSIVSRVVGEQKWETAAGPLREPVGAFEARLVQWRLGRAGDAYRIAGLAVAVVGGAALAWEAGVVASLIRLGGSLVRLGGGIGAVSVNIGITEAAYLIKVLLGPEEFRVGGFLMAAVDGYLDALGYRIGSGIGGWTGSRIGTGTLRGRIAAWIAGKLVTGAVGGATAAALRTFAHDVAAGSWSGVDTYVAEMEYHAVVGVILAFTADPFLRALLVRAGPTLIKAALVTRLLNAEGVTAERWAEAMALTGQRMEYSLGRSLSAAEARAWARAIGRRADEAGQGLAHARPTGTTSRVPARITPAHEASAHGALVHEAPARGALVHEASARGGLAHEVLSHEATTHGATTHEVPTHAAPAHQTSVSASAPGSMPSTLGPAAGAARAVASVQAGEGAEGAESARPGADAASQAEDAPPGAQTPPPVTETPRPRPQPTTVWPSWARLKEASLTDREAALDRRWYETARIEELRAREAHDPVAKELLNKEWGGVRRPYQPDRPTDPAIQEKLRADLREVRAAVEAERSRRETERLRREGPGGPKPSTPEPAGYKRLTTRAGVFWVQPTAKAAAAYQGTIGVARSDIPALAGELFAGGSPKAFGSYDPAHEIRPADNVVVPQAHGHAEQDLGQQIDARLARLTEAERAAARGRTVYIRVDQEVCGPCAAGLGSGTRLGVLARLSALHPDIVFEVTADDTSTVYRIVAGKRVR
ncbi:hypothetical protein [Streptomyces sp. NPDC093111]|uniref:hypothetical protein n=1 Tax=Streptomyces sp. NPDC093111 TaxID=3154978 RepID=UPI00343D35B8